MRFRQQKKTQQETYKIIEDPMEQSKALKLSAAVVGPSKVGKSVLSKNFAQTRNLLYVDVKEVAFCGMDPEILRRNYLFFKVSNKELKIVSDREGLQKRYAAYEQVVYNNYMFRTNFPYVPNFKEMGFNDAIYGELKRLDPLCGEMYHKEFENKLIANIISNISTPCILDMPPSVYENQDKKFFCCALTSIEKFKKEPESFPAISKYLKSNKMNIEDLIKIPSQSFEEMKDIIKKAGTVITLQYSEQQCESKNNANLFIENQNIIYSDLLKSVAGEVEYNYGKTVLRFTQSYHIIDTQKLKEMMDIMQVYMMDKKTELQPSGEATAIVY